MDYKKMEWLIWTQEVQELIPTQECDLSQVKIQESSLIQEVGQIKKLKLKSTFISPQRNVTS